MTQICIVPLKRVANADKYNPSSYEVCVERLNEDSCTVLSHSDQPPPLVADQKQLGVGQSQLERVKKVLQEKYGITGLTVHPLLCSLYHHNHNDNGTAISLLYVVPIPTNTTVDESSNVEFINFEDLLEQPGQLHCGNNREMLLSLDQWLSERHHIPTVGLQHLFSNEFSEVGVVQKIITNPLKNTPVPPKEESLVLSFNNPVFPA